MKNWEAIGSFGEIVSATAVIVSLVYLAIQLRTNSKILRASAGWDGETTFADLNDKASHDPQLSELTLRATSPEANNDDLDETERAQLWFSILSVVQVTRRFAPSSDVATCNHLIPLGDYKFTTHRLYWPGRAAQIPWSEKWQ